MARNPENHVWFGYNEEQRQLLDDLDFYGNNGWDRNGQAEELMPKLMAECASAGLSVKQIRKAMESIGYDPRTTHQLQRWDNKRRTSQFGR